MRRARTVLWLTGILLIPLVVAGAWYVYYPSRVRSRQNAELDAALESKDFARAEELLRGLLQEGPSGTRLHLLQVQVLRRLQRPDEAFRALREAENHGVPAKELARERSLLTGPQDSRAEARVRSSLADFPGDPELLLALAEVQAYRRHWGEAEDTYSKVLDRDADNHDALFGRGRVRQETRRFGAAAEDYRRLIRLSPGHFLAHLYLAHCLLSDARLDEAEAELKTCRQLDPRRVEPLVGLAGIAVEREDWNRAGDLLDQALGLAPNSLPALREQADLLLLRRNYEAAVPVLEKIIRLNPRDKQAHLKLSQAYRQQNKPDRADLHTRRYQELDAEEQRPRGKPAKP